MESCNCGTLLSSKPPRLKVGINKGLGKTEAPAHSEREPLPEVLWSYYQEQGEAESTEERNGAEQIHTWFHEASPSIRFGPISWRRSQSSGSR